MEESEEAQEIEALKAIWPELQDRPPVWNSPAVAVPVCPLGKSILRAALELLFQVYWSQRAEEHRYTQSSQCYLTYSSRPCHQCSL